MLNGLKKKLGILPSDETKEVEMTTENLTVTVDMANHEAVVAQLAEAATAIESLTAQLQAAQASLAQFEKEKAEAVAEAAKAKTDARLTKLQEVVGDAKAAELMVAFEGLDDKVFEAMAGALSKNMATEAESEPFVEKGVDAEVQTPVEADMVTRLAAKIKAEFAPKPDAK